MWWSRNMSETNEPRTIRLIIDGRLENVFLAGMAVQSFAMYSPLSEREAYNVRLSTVEAVNRSILRAGQPGSVHEVEVVVSLHRDRMVLKVCDSGKPVEPETREPAAFDPEKMDTIPEDEVRRFIIRSVMDEVSMERVGDRNEFTMVKGFEGKVFDD